jgi:TonB family protein
MQKDPFRDYASQDPSAPQAPRHLRVVPRRDDLLFQSLEYKESRKNAVVMSIVAHFMLLTILILIPLFLFDQLNVKRYYPVLLVPPPPHKQVLEVTHWKPVALPKPKPPEPIIAPPPRKPELTEVKLPDPPKPKPKPEEFKLPEVKVQPKPALLAETKRDDMRPEPPKPEVKTNVFGGSTGSSAKPTVDLPAKAVQTGGFGDPNGVKAEGRPDKTPNIGQLGSFDLPVGAGAGNGTGGAKGVRGIVASAGFGNGTATDNPGSGGGGRTGRATVQKGGFGDLDSPGASAPQVRKKESEAPQTAVEITFKPRPDYTAEARKLKVEGEVLVKVLFTASGQVRVLGVTRGLGHGLDENAIKAAEQIRFKPAAREGAPVDSTATVHIVFQLAY